MRASAPLTAVLLAAALGACAPEADAPPPEGTALAAADAIPVMTATAEAREIAQPVIATGSMAPVKHTDVGPRVDGVIEEVFVEVGARVKAGDPLFRTRDTEYALRVQELEARVKLAEARNRIAQNELKRTNTLGKRGVASAEAVDTVMANAQAAAAELAIARTQLDQARQALDDTVVKAPYDAVVTRKDVYEGRFMATRMPGGGGGGGGGVVQIMQIDVVAAIVYAPELELGRLRVGQPARVHIDGLGLTVEAEVHVLNDNIDSATRRVELRLGIANPDYRIKPGMFCRAEILPEPRIAVTLPRASVLGGGTQRYVYVERDGVARKLPIAARPLDAERFEVTSGLKAGDVVLTGPNVQRLFDGAPVAPIAQTAGVDGTAP